MDNKTEIFKLLKEQDDFDWIRDVNPIDMNIFKSEEYDLRDLDGLYFGNMTDEIYSFCYDCTPEDNKTLIYGTDNKPLERYLSDSGSYWSINGAPHPWNVIREYFNSGDWFLVDKPNNINESDDLDWIRNTPDPIPLPKKFSYYINMCGSGYSVEDLRDNFIRLFGSDYTSREQYSKCNWFDNNMLLNSEIEDGGVIISVSSYDGDIRGGWDGCSSLSDYEDENVVDAKSLTPEEFLRLYNPDIINESEEGDFDWVNDIEPMTLGELFRGDSLESGDLIYLQGDIHHGMSHNGSMYSDEIVVKYSHDGQVYHIGPPNVNEFLGVVDGEDYHMTRSDMNSLHVLGVTKSENINESEDGDFDWVNDIEPNLDLELGQLFYKYGVSKDTEQFFIREMRGKFDDIEFKDGKVLMAVPNHCVLTDLFIDNDSSQYGYINQWLAKKVLCDDDDFWEPYSDAYSDWEDSVWGLVVNDVEILNHVVQYLKENYLNGEYYVGSEGGDEVLLDENYLNYLVTKNLDQLGFIIGDDMEFSDLKNELGWAYDSGYNVASRDQIYNSVNNAITEELGKGEWESYTVTKLTGEVTRHQLVYDVTSVFWPTLSRYFKYCWGSCTRYYDGDPETQEDEFMEYCDDCWGLPYSDFIDFYSNELNEYSEEFNPSFDEYPDEDNIVVYFKEDVFNRL